MKKRFNLLDGSALVLSLLFLYCAIIRFVERRDPNLQSNVLVIGILFGLICMAVFLIHNFKYRPGMITYAPR